MTERGSKCELPFAHLYLSLGSASVNSTRTPNPLRFSMWRKARALKLLMDKETYEALKRVIDRLGSSADINDDDIERPRWRTSINKFDQLIFA